MILGSRRFLGDGLFTVGPSRSIMHRGCIRTQRLNKYKGPLFPFLFYNLSRLDPVKGPFCNAFNSIPRSKWAPGGPLCLSLKALFIAYLLGFKQYGCRAFGDDVSELFNLLFFAIEFQCKSFNGGYQICSGLKLNLIPIYRILYTSHPPSLL